MKTQLVCTFTKKHQSQETIDVIRKDFSLLNNKIFMFKPLEIKEDYMLSYNVIMDSYKKFLPNSIMVHQKRETNTIYTINALNELIMNLNNGILDKKYPIDWQNYKDTMMLKKPDGLKFLNIQTIKVYNL